jgi:capsular polysaccharide biosynthesis protein
LHRSSPKIFQNLLIATVLGVLLGIGSALFMEMLDRRIRTVADLELSLGGLPVLAQLRPAAAQISQRRFLLGSQLRLLQ